MNVTEKAPDANSLEETPPRAWGQGSCHYRRSYYQNGLVQQQFLPCKCLDCSYCGPKKKKSDYELAVSQFAAEEMVYMIRVPAYRVDHIRKQLIRQGDPTYKSVPVSADENVLFVPSQIEGSIPVTELEVRRVFLILRVSRRQVRSVGRWLIKPPGQKRNEENQGVTLTKSFVGEEAFRNVAGSLGMKVNSYRDTIYFRDEANLGPEHYKVLLVAEEKRVRQERKARRDAA